MIRSSQCYNRCDIQYLFFRAESLIDWLDLAPEKTILTVYCENWEVRKDTG